MQATLARHEEELARIRQWLPETDAGMRPVWESIVDELAATRESIRLELLAIHERLDAQAAAQANTDRAIAAINGEIAVINGEIVSINGQIAAINGEIAAIKETLAVLVNRTEDMSRTLIETNSRVGNLTGTRYERRVVRIILRRPSRTLGLSPAQVLHTDWGETVNEFVWLLNDADAISDDEYEDLMDADIIIAGQNAAGQRAYAVIEISVTVSSSDVNRAARRAGTLARATGDECAAVVIGSEIPDAERERAARNEVAIISIAERVD